MALTDNLLAAYKLNDTSDYSGNSNTLTNTGSTTFGTGLIGDAALFGDNNSTKVLTTPTLSIATTDDWCVSLFWKAPSTYYTNLSTFEMVYGTAGVGTNNRFIFIRDSANGRWSMFNSAFSNSFTSESVTAGNWYHLIFEKSGSTATFYVNTVSKASRTVGTTTSLTPKFGFTRQDEATWKCSGDVDLLYIWNRALTSGEKTTMYGSGSGYEISIGGSSSVKSVNGLAYASVKSKNGLAIASIKSFNGLA